MNSDEWFKFDKICHDVARYICRGFPDVEFEDCKQHCWETLLVLQSKGKCEDPDDKFAKSTLRYRATEWAEDQRRQHLTISVQYAYRTKDVAKLFETFFDRGCWENAKTPDDAISELGSTPVEMSSDLSRAFDKLPKKYQGILAREYVFKDLETVEERRLLSRVLGRTADLLNQYHGHQKVGRKAISNAHAQFIIDTQADETLQRQGNG